MINNRTSANNYYKIINDLVDDYIDKWKVRPSNLKTYLSGDRFTKFLERNKLKDIPGAELVLKDIINDRYNMEKDGVLKFEKFNLFESSDFKLNINTCIYKGVEKSDIAMEKAIADHFDVNLGDIDIINSDKHNFKINDWNGEDIEIIIYSNSDIDIIKSNFLEYYTNYFKNKKVESDDDLIHFNISNVCDDNKLNQYLEDLISLEVVIHLISNCLEGFIPLDRSKDSYIWKKHATS